MHTQVEPVEFFIIKSSIGVFSGAVLQFAVLGGGDLVFNPAHGKSQFETGFGEGVVIGLVVFLNAVLSRMRVSPHI